MSIRLDTVLALDRIGKTKSCSAWTACWRMTRNVYRWHIAHIQ